MHAILALALMASPLLALQQQDRATEFMVQRLKDRLKLSDDQAAKVKEILTKDGEERTKMDDARTEKINALLSDEQKKQYEEMRTQFQRGRGGQGAQGGGQQFGFGGGGARGPLGAVNIE